MTMRVRVGIRFTLEEQVSLLQIFLDRFFGFLKILPPNKVGSPIIKIGRRIQKRNHRQIKTKSKIVVVLPINYGGMNYPGAFTCSNEICASDIPCFLASISHGRNFIKRFVPKTDKFRSLHFFDYLILFISKDVLQTIFSKNKADK